VIRRRTFGKGRPRREPGTMNGLERDYATDILDKRKAAGEIDSYVFEGVTLVILEPQTAKKARYTPDFAVYLNDMTLEFHEVKGFMEDDAWIKLKAASDKWPHRFVLAKRAKISEGGQWTTTEV
jgi:hypothetical protein